MPLRALERIRIKVFIPFELQNGTTSAASLGYASYVCSNLSTTYYILYQTRNENEEKHRQEFQNPTGRTPKCNYLVDYYSNAIVLSCFIPLVHIFTKNEKEIGIGMFFSVIAMVVAALTERKRLQICKEMGSGKMK
ncbi:putative peptide/nitrate transporter-like [Abeliophyllum distichum]|uniref:Peptide/nitrate transporter-like n=1 Tax=Abeliophyllum distichum TaxID=126358 RepID=A0ABD1SCK8_9LAMI